MLMNSHVALFWNLMAKKAKKYNRLLSYSFYSYWYGVEVENEHRHNIKRLQDDKRTN